ncbi:MAG: ABC transporter ATP-binding protein [Bdellovibrionaceae bacterium]|nr:ABC transporter ATP-binding protein [Pseudobdellovibrionaceae bacterium]
MIYPAVEFQSVCRSYGSVRANADVSFRVESGTIHGIVGENGAGKSTAMKLLFGLEQRDSGRILVHGQEVHFRSAAEAMRAGIGMVHQHFMLAGPMSVLDNLLLFQEGKAWDLLDRNKSKEIYSLIAAKFGMEIDFDKKISDLSVGEQQRVEILKILSQNTNIIILDEPTAVLTPQEVEALFVQLRKLKNEGKTILVITHKLKEVLSITDNISVFRRGTVVGEFRTKDTSLEDLATAMVGKRNAPLRPVARAQEDAFVLELQNLKTDVLDIQTLAVRSGEILGVAGVEGNGQQELIQILACPSEISGQGLLTVCGNDASTLTTAQIRDLGVSFFPEDRLRYGVLPESSATENFLLGNQNLFSGPLLNWKKIRYLTRQTMEKFAVQPPDPDLAIGRFSGGNQQKFVVGRELWRNPSLVIAAHPTRGVDIAAADFIHEQLLEARQRGAGVLLISTELDEHLLLADRLVVLYKGRIVAEFSRDKFCEEKIGAAMAGKGFAT